MLLLVLTCASAGFALLAYLISQRKPKNFPPGPWGLPILGHLPLLGLDPPKTALAWMPKYGPIIGVDFASFPCVIITGHKLAKEAYAIPAMCGRPKFQITARRSGGEAHGIIFTSGNLWREQRAFTVRRLRQLGGFGTKSMESVIVEQALEMIDGLRTQLDTPISTHCTFSIAFWNTMWGLIAGKPFKQSDPAILRFTKLVVDGLADNNVFTMLSMLIPWFANNFPVWLTRDDVMDSLLNRTRDLFQPYVDQHWTTHVEGQPRDFIDAYIDEIKLATDPGSSFHGERGKQGLMATLLDLFIAGIETTGSTFEWIPLLLASYPDVQDKLVGEIQDKIGSQRHPSLADRASMPYTEALLHEVMRYRTLITMSVFHSTTEDVHFHGYDIPKDTMLFINVYEAHNNKETWGDPENFRPERWLNDKGEFERHEGFMPFSTGKRICLGEQLARDQLFLFTTSLFQSLKVSLDPNSPPPTLEPKVGATTASARPHKLVYSERRW